LAFVTIGAVAFALRGVEIRRVLDLLAARGGLLVFVPLPQAVGALAHACAWQLLLASLGHRVARIELFANYLAAESARMTLPAGVAAGESLAAWLVSHHAAVPIADSVAALAVKKCLVMLTNGLVAALALGLAYREVMGASLAALRGSTLWWLLLASSLGLLFAAAALAVAMRDPSLVEAIRSLLSRIPVAALRRALEENRGRATRAGLRLALLFRRDAIVRLTVPGSLLFLQWLAESVETWLILRLLGAPLSFPSALAVEVLASLLRSLVFVVPNGAGVQDVGYVAMLAAFGVPEATTVGVAFVCLKRLKELVWMVAGYLCLWIRRPQRVESEQA
jgi:uncharacterized protein (TIRG00374 family)